MNAWEWSDPGTDQSKTVTWLNDEKLGSVLRILPDCQPTNLLIFSQVKVGKTTPTSCERRTDRAATTARLLPGFLFYWAWRIVQNENSGHGPTKPKVIDTKRLQKGGQDIGRAPHEKHRSILPIRISWENPTLFPFRYILIIFGLYLNFFHLGKGMGFFTFRAKNFALPFLSW